MGIDDALDDSKTQTGTVRGERGTLPGFTICKTNLKHLQIHTKNHQLIVACVDAHDKPEIMLK